MEKITNYSVQLLEADMDRLKAKSEKKQSNRAITAAIEHYLECKDV